MKNKGWFIGIIFFIIVGILIYYRKEISEKLSGKFQQGGMTKSISDDGEWNTFTYELPTSMDTEVFGKYYWNALHDIAHEIPCSLCRVEAESFMEFFHDFVNFKLDKPLYDESNYTKWLDRLSEVKEKMAEKKIIKSKVFS